MQLESNMTRKCVHTYSVFPLETCHGVVGSCVGSSFQPHHYGNPIETITLWWSGHIVKGVKLTWFDGNEASFKHIAPWESVNVKSFTFHRGERLVGDVVLGWAPSQVFGVVLDGLDRFCYIKFSTSDNRTFEAGSRYWSLSVPSGDSFIAGVTARTTDGILGFGLIMFKPILGLTLDSVSYPTLDVVTKVKAPKVIRKETYCNDNSVPRMTHAKAFEAKVTHGKKSCFKLGGSFSYGQTYKVEAGIPKFGVSAGGETSWKVEAHAGFEHCWDKTEETKEQLTFGSFELASNSRTTMVYSQWQGSLDQLPWTGRMRVDFGNGLFIDQPVEGTYSGVAYTQADQYFTDYETGVQSCRAGNQ